MRFLASTTRIVAFVAAVETAVLAILVARANPDLGAAGLVELIVALAWISAVTNVAVGSGLALAWRCTSTGWRDGLDWRAFLVAGLVAAHLVWALLNRLTLAQAWMRSPYIMTLDGVLQLAAVALAGTSVVAAGLWWPGRRGRAALALGLAAAVGGAVLLSTLASEARQRRYDLRDVRRAATSGSEPGTRRLRTVGGRKVLVLAIDGMDWALAKPLLEAGLLPNFAALVREGSIGYLDNGDHSYSPLIWNTVLTGRSPEAHGIYSFRTVALPRSGVRIRNLPVMSPSLHVVHGLRHLFERVPHPGLWSILPTGSYDRRERTVWEVATDFGRSVVVIEPLTSFPLTPVDGAIVSLRDPFFPRRGSPPEVVEAWRVARVGVEGTFDEMLSGEDPIGRLRARELRELEFTGTLLASRPFDLAVIYTDWIDDLGHVGWNFFDAGGGLVTTNPEEASIAAWERLVLEHVEAPVVRAYRELDAFVGGLRERFDADFVVVSDHGWAFNGHLHYGSPEGVVLLSGPSFRPGGELRDVRIEDIAPTTLAVLGVPLSEELEGVVVEQALAAPLAVRTVDAYRPPAAVGVPMPVEAAQLERLRALGYVP